MISTLQTRARSAITLSVLAVILLLGVTWAWAAVTRPFPGASKATPTCIDTSVSKGDVVRRAGVTVSVLNAGRREGLAKETLKGFVDAGFGQGVQSNAPTDAEVKRVQVWASDPKDPAVRLVRTYLGKRTKVVDRDAGQPGISVVVGDNFDGLRKGRKSVVARKDATVCAPPGLG